MIYTKHEGYRAGIRLYPFKDTPSAPPTPDPTAVSAAQTQSNIETARKNAELNRVNQYTPYGNLTYNKKQGATFDETGYNAAMDKYNAAQQAGNMPAPVTGAGNTVGGNQGQGEGAYGLDQTVTGQQGTGPTGVAPTREQFTNPGSDEWEAHVTLNPEQQALLDSDNRIKAQLGSAAEQGLGRVTDSMGQPFNMNALSSYRDAPTGGGAKQYNPAQAEYTKNIQGGNIQKALPNSDYAGQRTAVEDAIYSRVNPQLQRDRAALDSRLANQGIMPGSEAYTTAIDESNRAATDARYQAVLAGGQEQSRLAGLDLAAGNFANSAQAQEFGQGATNAALNNSVNDTAFNQGLMTVNQNNAANQQDFSQQIAGNQQNNQQRQQQLQEQAYLRSLPLNELNALRTGSQVQNPTFGATPQTNVAPTNTSGNEWQAYQAEQNNVSNATAQNNSFMNGLFSLGAAGITKFSDRRLKRNIERIGTYRGIGVYNFDYVWGTHATGLMADEVETIQPDAIGESMGFKTVDYSKV